MREARSPQREDGEVDPEDFSYAKHVSFWLRHVRMLPNAYQGVDSQRMTIAFFCLSALDVLVDETASADGRQRSALEVKVPEDERAEMADWIWARQLAPEQGGGFRGSPCLGPSTLATIALDPPHLAMTYTALLSLAILRDDFTRLDREGIKLQLRNAQEEDGSFAPSPGSQELDARFVFCAFATCYMLNDWTAINVDAAVDFILRSRNYDYAFGQGPMQESHGGSTYCALAALSLAGRLEGLPSLDRTVQWLLARQSNDSGGFNGRIAKPVDTCYSFWCGASLSMLGASHLIDRSADVRWLLSGQTQIGGIPKTPDAPPDAMHSYLSIAALSLLVVGVDAEGDSDAKSDKRLEGATSAWQLRKIDPALNLSETSKEWLKGKLWVD